MEDLNIFIARRVPARLTIEQTGQLLGFHPDALDFLVSIGLLDVLGGPSAGSQKMFAGTYILELAADVKWLSKATLKVRQHIQKKNAGQKSARCARLDAGVKDAA